MPLGNEGSHVFDGLTVRGGLAVADMAGNVAAVDYNRFSAATRAALMQKAQGYFAETLPRAAAQNATVHVSGTIYGSLIGLLAGDIVTNVSCAVITLGSGYSGAGHRFALYSKTGTLLASTGDVSSTMGSTGTKTIAFTTPYTVTTDDVYYVASIAIATTPVTLTRGSGNSAATQAVTGGIATQVNQTGQTDLTNPATLAVSGSSFNHWFALS